MLRWATTIKNHESTICQPSSLSSTIPVLASEDGRRGGLFAVEVADGVVAGDGEGVEGHYG